MAVILVVLFTSMLLYSLRFVDWLDSSLKFTEWVAMVNLVELIGNVLDRPFLLI